MKTLRLIILPVFLLGILFSATPTYAQARFTLPDCVRNGECGINDIVNTAIKVGEFFQGLAGAVALALFVYGGVLMLLSGGREEYITKGKNVLTAAVVGLIIVLGAFVIVKTLESALKGGATGSSSVGGGGPCECTVSGLAAGLIPSDVLANIGNGCRGYGAGCAWDANNLTCSCPGTTVSVAQCASVQQQAQAQVAAIPGISVECSGGGSGAGTTTSGDACTSLSGGGFQFSCTSLSPGERDRRVQIGECVAGLCPGDRNNVCCANATGGPNAGQPAAPGTTCNRCECADGQVIIGVASSASECNSSMYINFCRPHGGGPNCIQ